MKSVIEFLPRCLAALPSLDFFNPDPGVDPNAGGGSSTSVFDQVHVTLYSAGTGAGTNYSELHLNSPNDGGTTPITHDADTERAIFFMPIPKSDASWSMSVVVSNAIYSDTVNMQGVTGKYTTLRASLVTAANLKFEVDGEFFTIKISDSEYHTYVNVNQPNETIRLKYSKLNVFDDFRVSLIGKSNV